MEYTRLKITYPGYAKRFYRIIAIKGDPDLPHLGAIIAESMRADFEHCWLFETKQASYEPDSWVEYDDEYSDTHPMSRYHLSDLPDRFAFTYDTGEDYSFNCTRMKKGIVASPDDDPLAFVTDGKGQGIFENDHYTLSRYLRGEIDPESSEENEDEMFFLPMNMTFEKFGDFDSPLDLKTMRYDDSQFDAFLSDMTAYSKETTDSHLISDDPSPEDLMNVLNTVYPTVAVEIFMDPEINSIYRKLIKTHDMNDVYGMFVSCSINILKEMDGPDFNVDEFTKRRIAAYRKLR